MTPSPPEARPEAQHMIWVGKEWLANLEYQAGRVEGLLVELRELQEALREAIEERDEALEARQALNLALDVVGETLAASSEEPG